jgi:hypothetical protein
MNTRRKKSKMSKTNKQLLIEAKEEIRAEFANEKKEEMKSILRQMCVIEDTLAVLKKQLDDIAK